MKQFIFTAVWLLAAAAAYPQIDCHQMLRDAEKAEKSGDYRGAIRKYTAAKKCDPGLEKNANDRILAVFTEIDKLREKADHSRKIAEKRAKEAEIARQAAEKAEKEVLRSERVGQNIVTAMKIARQNPTIGLRMAEYVMKNNTNKNNPTPAIVFNDIYSNKSIRFYHTEIQCGQGLLYAVAYSPDGTKLLTAGQNSAKLWDLNNPEKEPILFDATEIGTAVFSPDGKYVLTNGNRDYAAWLWSLDGKVVRKFTGHSNLIPAVAFSPTGDTVLTASYDKTVKLWNAHDGREIKTFYGHEGAVRAAVFSPDGKFILSGGEDEKAIRWSTDGLELATFTGHHDAILAVAFSPDGQTILTGSNDNNAATWELDGKKKEDIRGHRNGVFSVCFSKDGTKILTASYDNTAKIWTSDGREIATLIGHSDYLSDAVFSVDNKEVVTASYDGTIKRWKIDEPGISGKKDIPPLAGDFNTLAFKPAGTEFLTRDTNSIHVKNVKDSLLYRFRAFNDATNNRTWFAFSPTGSSILTAENDTLKIWSVEGRLLQQIKMNGRFLSLVIAPDGKSVIVINREGIARLLYLDKPDKTHIINSNDDLILSAAFSPDGNNIVTRGNTQTAWLRDREGRKIRELSGGHTEQLITVAFSPDGKRILTGGRDNAAALWDTEGKLLAVFKGHNRAVFKATSSPDGKTILTISNDNTLKLWTPEGYEISSFPVYFNGTISAGFTRDSRWVVAVDNNDNNKVYAWPTQEEFLATYVMQIPHITLIQNGLILGEEEIINSPDADLLVYSGNNNFERDKLDIAGRYYEKALSLHFSPEALLGLYKIAERKEAPFDFKRFLETDKPEALRYFANFFYDRARFSEAYQLLDKAEKLGHEPSALIRLHYTAEATGRPFNFQHFLESEIPSELVEYGDYFYRNYNWEKAGQLYAKADSINPTPQVLLQLHRVAFRTKKPFDTTRFLSSENANELRTYGDYFFNADTTWGIAKDLYEKAETKEHNAYVLIRLHRISEKTGTPFDTRRFYGSDKPEEILQYARYMSDQGKWENAYGLFAKSDSIRPSEEGKIGKIRAALILGKPFDFQQLLSSNEPATMLRYARIIRPTVNITKKNPSNLRQLYDMAAQLENKAFSLDTAFARRERYNLADAYNTLGYNQLFITDTIGPIACEWSIKRGLEIDPGHPYLLTNLPLAYLFQNRWPEAEKIYLEQKDKECQPGRFPLYKDAFLDDLNTFDERGVKHPDFAKVKAIMEGKNPVPPADDSAPPGQ